MNSLEDERQPSFLDNAQQKLSEGVQFAKNHYTKFKNDHPKLAYAAQKIIPYALAAFAAILNPIATIVGFTVGLIFTKQVAPIIDKIKEAVADAFQSSNIFGKSLIALGAVVSVIFIPSVITTSIIGANAGCSTRKLLRN